MKDIFDLFNIPRPGSLSSSGPGTGPTQADTKTSTKPAAQGGTLVAPHGPNDATGYGGSADTVTVHSPPAEPARHGILPYRGMAEKGTAGPLVPRYTVLYDTLRSRDAWRYCADIYVSGTLTPNTSGDANTPVINSTNISLIQNRLSQFPGGLALALVVRHFSCAPVATTATGALSFWFEDGAQNHVPLTDIFANASGSGSSLPALCPSLLTDSGLVNLGKLHVNSTSVATPAQYAWQMGFSLAYHLPEPAFRGYAQLGVGTDAAYRELEGIQRRS